MPDQTLSEMIARAAAENASIVDPVTPKTPDHKQGISGLAKALYAGGLGADVSSTLFGFKHGYNEANPLINFAGNKAALPIGAGMEIGGLLLAKKLLGDRHPKIMNALVGGAGIIHGTAAAKNVHTMSKP